MYENAQILFLSFSLLCMVYAFPFNFHVASMQGLDKTVGRKRHCCHHLEEQNAFAVGMTVATLGLKVEGTYFDSFFPASS